MLLGLSEDIRITPDEKIFKFCETHFNRVIYDGKNYANL